MTNPAHSYKKVANTDPMLSQSQFAAPSGAPHDFELGTKVKDEHETHFGHDYHPTTGKITIDSATGQAPRRCTDLACCFVFLIYLLFCLTFLTASWHHGNVGRLTHGVDFYGRTCGVDAGVENAPFLYWCRQDPESVGVPTVVDLDRPSCVAYCPETETPTSTPVQCLLRDKHDKQELTQQQLGNVRTMVFEMQESIVETAPYVTHPRGGRYCIPKDPKLEDIVLNDNRALGPLSARRWLTMLGTLSHVYWVLLLSAVLTSILGYTFLYGIRYCPRSLAYPFVIPALIVCAILAFVFTFAFLPLISRDIAISQWYEQHNPLYQRWEYVLASVISLVLSVVLWLVTLCLFGMAANFEQVSVADLLTCSQECIGKIPCFTFIPVFETIAKFLVFMAGIQGLRVLAADGSVHKDRIKVDGAKFAGLSRQFVPSTEDPQFYVLAFFWILGWKWTMEIVQAVAQWLICWSVFQWWRVKKDNGFKGPPPPGTLSEGFKNVILYHGGTMIIGALSIPIWRPWKFVFWCTSEIVPEQEREGIFGRIVACLCCCLQSMVGGVKAQAQEIMRMPECANKDGFNDVAIRSNDYMQSVEKGHSLLEHSHRVVQYLYRDLNRMTLNILGVSSISTISSLFVYLVVANLEVYKDPSSDYYVADPFAVTILAAILSSYISFGWMSLWDHTSDCLLYCYCWHRRWSRKTVNEYIPDSLRFIVGFDDTEHDRYPYYGRAKNNMYLRFWMPMFGMDAPGAPKAKPDKAPHPTETGPVFMPGTHGHGGVGTWQSGTGQPFHTIEGTYNQAVMPWMQAQQEEISGAYNQH